jgi:hypothetical protein
MQTVRALVCIATRGSLFPAIMAGIRVSKLSGKDKAVQTKRWLAEQKKARLQPKQATRQETFPAGARPNYGMTRTNEKQLRKSGTSTT